MIKRERLEEYVEALLNGEITREKLAENLHIDLRYLSAQISELQETNPELYSRYIQKYPYKPKQITHIDYEAIVVEMLKQRLNIRQAIEKYRDNGVSEKTLRRRINSIKKTNPQLYDLYRNLALLNRGNIELTEEQEIQFSTEIEKLESKPIVLGELTDKRKLELENIETEFLTLKQKGLSNEAAAKQMGTTFPVLYKQFADLRRIRKEESFRESLKVENQPKTKKDINSVTETEKKKMKELYKEGETIYGRVFTNDATLS